MKSLVSSYFKKFLDSVKSLASPCLNKLSAFVKGLPSAKRYILLVPVAVLILIFAFGLSRCSAQEAPGAEALTYVVTIDSLDVHKKPTASSRVLGQLPLDLEIEILEESTGKDTIWGRIDALELDDGTKIKAGWIDMQFVAVPGADEPVEDEPQSDTQAEPAPSVAATMGTVTASKLNIRKGPNADYETDGAYYKGERIEILETKTVDDTVWGCTNLGWIGMGYVRMDGTAVSSEDIHPKLVTNGEYTILGYGVVDLGELNVRLGPGTEYAKATTVKQGQRYAYYQTSTASGTWVRIEDGWVSTEYFYLEGTLADDALTGTVVNTDELNIRSGPNTSFRSTGKLKQGETVEVLAQVGGWGYTDQGWVFMSYVEANAPTYTTGTCTVTRGLNIRQEPTADSEKVGELVEGNVVTILEVDGNWGRIVQGWINLKYVEYDTVG